MSTNIKYVETLTPEKRQAIIKNSVMAMPNSVVSNPTELKKAFVKPIVNNDGTPCLADEIDRIAEQTNAGFEAMGNNKVNKSGDTMTGDLLLLGDGERSIILGIKGKESPAVEVSGETKFIGTEGFSDFSTAKYGPGSIRLQTTAVDADGELYPAKEIEVLLPTLPGHLARIEDIKLAEETVRPKPIIIELILDHDTYNLAAVLYESGSDKPMSISRVDLPLEEMVVDGRFDDATDSVILTLKNGNEVKFSVAQLVNGLVSNETFQNFVAQKGQANGFAGLDANGKVPKEQLPAGSGGDGISAAEFEELLIESLTNPTEEWTDEERVAACETIGAVGKKDRAMEGKLGLVSASDLFCFQVNTSGNPMARMLSLDVYKIATLAAFISKGTLENIKNTYVKEGITTNSETLTDEEKASACDWLGAVGKTDLSEIYDILDLAGVTETIETTSTYDVRDTAQVGDSTLFVIPDTPTSVTKVEGNSVATDNMLNVYALQDTDYYRVRVEDMGEEIVFTGLITADTQLANIGKFSDLIPTAKIGDILYIYAGPTNAAFPAGIFYVGDGGTSWQANGISPLTVTKEILDGLISVTFTLKENTGMRVQNFCVAKHTLNRNNWTPFFTGLKSAAFNGITSSSKNLWNDSVNTWTKTSTTSTKTLYKSNWIEIPVGVKNLATSIDGAGVEMSIYGVRVGNTEYTLNGLGTGYSYVNLKNTGYYGEGITAVKLGVYLPTDTNIEDIKTQIEIGDEVTEYVPYVSSKLLFPLTENPFGQTIDFANKKVLNYGVEITLTGEENVGYYTYANSFGNAIRLLDALSSDENLAQYICTDAVGTFTAGGMRLGLNSTTLIWFGITDLLGFTTSNSEATAEEKAVAIINFKAWLAKRYAEGNPVVIRYVSSELQSSRDMTAEELANLNFSDDGATYTPIENGIEYQAGNSNAVYGANNTVTQLYDMYRKLGGA